MPASHLPDSSAPVRSLIRDPGDRGQVKLRDRRPFLSAVETGSAFLPARVGWRRWLCYAGVALVPFAGGMQVWAWSPGPSDPDAVGSPEVPLRVDAGSRHDVVAFYHSIYRASEGGNALVGWTGNVAGCSPGTTTEEFKLQVRRRVNWFRAMAGMPGDIVFHPAFNELAQAAALIMAWEQDAEHDPGKAFGTDGCWTENGQRGASRSNLAVGLFGVEAIDGYVDDPGIYPVGHRTWILDARTRLMGTGDVPSLNPAFPLPANCLHVVDSASRGAPAGGIYSWPPAGHVPAEMVYNLWSLHIDEDYATGLHFSEAVVTMAVEATGQSVPVTIRHRNREGAVVVAPHIVWEPDWTAWGNRPPLESPIRVTVSQIRPGTSAAPVSHTYTVTAIDPFQVTVPQTLTGPNAAPASGAAYAFAPLTDAPADRYEVGAWRLVNGSVTEGAEDATAARVVDQTHGGRVLRKTLPRVPAPPAGSGLKCFHLVIPDYDTDIEGFEFDPAFVAGPQSELRFHRRFGWITPDVRLEVHVSTDLGLTWTTIWEKAGTPNPEAAWSQVVVSLKPFDGHSIRLRFQLRQIGDSYYDTATLNDGALIDNITCDKGDTLASEKITPIDTAAPCFVFDELLAGQPLAVAQKWRLQVRPVLGGHVFPFAPPFTLTVIPAVAGFDHWAIRQRPGKGLLKFDDDPDGAGLPPGLRYAFGLDSNHPHRQPPAPIFADGQWSLEFDPSTLPYPVAGLRYDAEVSSDGKQWAPLTNSAPNDRLQFILPPGPSQFIRWKVTHLPGVSGVVVP